MKLIATTSLALGLGLALTAAAPQEGVDVGDKPTYQFRQPLLNGKGVKSLADLRGKPTVIDFWGTR